MNDISDLLESLRRAPRILSQFAGTIPADKLEVRRGDGFWTVAEHVTHLAQVQPMLLQRIERFLIEDRPVFVPFLPGQSDEGTDTPPPMSLATAVDEFTSCRARQLALLETAGSAAWGKSGTHPEYEAYSLYILTRHILMHDHWHMYRMEELWLTRDAYLTQPE